ncbi:MAG: efflux RND transporter permease subunit, partial [Verrucomicrobia bacterium]|nr:efflux RND transporter permease subunit [Verrucomicrobiota bacterium]
FRPAKFIESATHNLHVDLLIGAILVVLILLVFLQNIKAAVISLLAIPLSLIAAITMLYYLGISLNTMTMGGLAISIGLLVDDAVITCENIFRRLRENRGKITLASLILNATFEMRSAVVYATIIIACVFIPVLTLSAIAGSIFKPLAIAYILATFASLCVALTLTPALAYLFFSKHPPEHTDPLLVHWLKERYSSLLRFVERHQIGLFSAVGILILASISVYPFLGKKLFPAFEEGQFIIHMNAIPGTSLEESVRMGNRLTHELKKFPFIENVAQRAGRAKEGDDIHGTHQSEIDVTIKANASGNYDPYLLEIHNVFDHFPGARFSIKTPLAERIDEVISGFTASMVINIFGNDLDILDKKAESISKILQKIPGISDIYIQSTTGMPEQVIKLKKENLVRFGFTPVDVLSAIYTAYQGTVVGQTFVA